MELLERCYGAGLKVSLADGQKLNVSVPDTPEAELLLEELRAHKQEVIDCLRTLPPPGGHLLRLAVELGLQPRCRCTLRPRTAEEAASAVGAVTELCSRNPGRDSVLVKVVRPDGSTEHHVLRAHADRGVRKAMAMIVRDCNLGGPQRAAREQARDLSEGGRNGTPIQR
ncbi:hypothetical protein A9A59_2414 [Tepidiforma thermophila]|uniref:Uncharacterized protein n=1 Tax=Tepidiforma thermophila (strain KCTC 52669 / CGMCC 1.13589 / G233) TaxID=2761530 RepID=A0A2A9HH57_TEPT2|nr:hypothetical protein A9A59_2414 [Tepidiforma thermophila]